MGVGKIEYIVGSFATQKQRSYKMQTNQELAKRYETLEKLITRAWTDEVFKQRLIAEPAKVLQEELGLEVPDFAQVKVLEETADTRYIVIPYRVEEGNAELKDEDVEAVAAAGGSGGEQVTQCKCRAGDLFP
jgi:hypothetical protein